MAFHSLPLLTRESGLAGSAGEGGVGEDDPSLRHVRDMLGEVKLLHLHPTAAFGGTSGHSAPDCVLYQV